MLVLGGAVPLRLVAQEGAAHANAETSAEVTPAADLHVHLSSPEGAAFLAEVQRALTESGEEAVVPSTPRTAREALAALDRAGIEQALVISNAYMLGMPDLLQMPSVEIGNAAERVRAENTYVAEQAAANPDRLTAACSVNPLLEYALDELEYCLEELTVPVLKLHFTNSDLNLRSGDHRRRLREVFTTLARARAGAIVHMRTRAEDYGARDARLFIDDVLVRVPGLPIHIAHMTGWGGYDDATDAALSEFARALRDGRLNPGRISFGLGAVVFQPEAAGADTALVNTVRARNEKLADRIREVGTAQVVYATDWPSWPPVPDAEAGIAANVGLLRAALPLTADELAEVFSNTGILGRLPPRP